MQRRAGQQHIICGREFVAAAMLLNVGLHFGHGFGPVAGRPARKRCRGFLLRFPGASGKRYANGRALIRLSLTKGFGSQTASLSACLNRRGGPCGVPEGPNTVQPEQLTVSNPFLGPPGGDSKRAVTCKPQLSGGHAPAFKFH
jgi:hypothetical protein